MNFALSFILTILIFIVGFYCGYLTDGRGKLYKEIADLKKENKRLQEYIIPNEDKLPIWDIVRYHNDGEYDCVWHSGMTKRDAEKYRDELNNDYHRNYGYYVVERNT